MWHVLPEMKLLLRFAIVLTYKYSIPFILVAENTDKVVRIRLRHIQ